jgi:3-keto-disaccharide hydrolase
MRRFRMARFKLLALATSTALLLPGTAAGQAKHYPLETTDGLRLHNVAAVPATLHGKKGLRLTLADETARLLERMTPEERAQVEIEQLAWIEGLEFSSGVIEAEVAGAPGAGAFEGARGFVGIAFRLQQDMKTYDAFYLRPTNGRAEDQERRNHSAQYISHPDWPWFRLRRETPSKYEAYVDLVPGEWTKIKIEVRGARARLYVHGKEQPTLIVNDVKSGAQGKGTVALWLGPGTVAHFRNLSVERL